VGCNTDGNKRDFSVDDDAMQMFESEILEDEWTENVTGDLEKMNRDKFGRPFSHTDRAIEWGMMYRTSSGKSYRRTVGAVNRLLRKSGHPEISLTQFYDRAQSLAESRMSTCDVTDARVLAYGAGDVPPEKGMTAAMDSTGMSLNRHGGWLQYFWNREKRNGWVKVHAIVNTDSNEILAYVITDESCGDTSCAERLIETAKGAGNTMSRILGDAAYDKIELWRAYGADGYCTNLKTPLLKKYNGGRVRSRGCPKRAAHVRKIRDEGREKWKSDIGYGRRWKIECTFSDLKRMFGDVMRSRCKHRVASEMYWMIRCHNLYKSIRKTVAGRRPAE